MICVQNGPLNCKNSSQECTKNRYFETKNGKIFWGGAIAPSPNPCSSGEGDTPLGVFGASISRAYSTPTSAPSLAHAELDHSVPPRVWKSGYGHVCEGCEDMNMSIH